MRTSASPILVNWNAGTLSGAAVRQSAKTLGQLPASFAMKPRDSGSIPRPLSTVCNSGNLFLRAPKAVSSGERRFSSRAKWEQSTL